MSFPESTHELTLPGGRVVARLAYRPGLLFRMRGLLGRNRLPHGTGIWLRPCNSIHMFFMKFSIDALFLDRNLRVVRVVSHLRPWSLVWPVKGAASCVELPAGTAEESGIGPGMVLAMRETGGAGFPASGERRS